jgi:arsenate reductase (thioredoxin)
MLHVRLFGGTHVLDGGHVLGPGDFGGRKPQRILEILALHRGHQVSKDRLADILWAGTPPPDHVATLESYISVLRRRLQPGIPARRSVIRTLPRAYMLDPDTASTDLDLFDDLIVEAGNRSGRDAHRLLDQASALASTDLLDSPDDTGWAEPIRTDYRQRAVRAALRAGELCLPDDAEGALRLAGRALGLDILCEPAWRLMIRAHAAAGQRGRALHSYRCCRRLLAQELGIRPAPQTRAVLADAIAACHRPGGQVGPDESDLGTVLDAALTLFEQQWIGEVTDGLDDAVRVVAALLPFTKPSAMTSAIDTRQALSNSSVRLHDEFDGTLGHEIVQRFLYGEYGRLLANSTIRNYVPLLAERSARQRLHALTGTDSDSRTVTVVFLHTPGAAHSRMALGFFHHLAGDRAVAWCEGHEPADRISAAAIAAMAERGIDITGRVRRPWADQLVRTVDIVVCFDRDDPRATFPGRRYLNWRTYDLTDDVERVRLVRDDIERKVRALLADLRVPPVT